MSTAAKTSAPTVKAVQVPLQPDEQLSGRQYQLLQQAFDHFNARLFAGELPQVLITLHRHKKAAGYFWAERFTLRNAKAGDKIVHEIALNPECFLEAIPTARTLSTLVHEQAHLWQEELGKRNPRKCYHNREWADKMEEVGLMPSVTGEKGGKRTGQSCSHYIIENGPFAIACARFLEEINDAILINAAPRLSLTVSKDRKKNKVCFECLTCQQKAWAKPTAKLMCGKCKCDMLSKHADVE